MGASLPVSLLGLPPMCGQCGSRCPRVHFTRACVYEGRCRTMHLCSRQCIRALEKRRCYLCLRLDLTLRQLSPHRYYCVGNGQARSCAGILTGPEIYEHTFGSSSAGTEAD